MYLNEKPIVFVKFQKNKKKSFVRSRVGCNLSVYQALGARILSSGSQPLFLCLSAEMSVIAFEKHTFLVASQSHECETQCRLDCEAVFGKRTCDAAIRRNGGTPKRDAQRKTLLD